MVIAHEKVCKPEAQALYRAMPSVRIFHAGCRPGRLHRHMLRGSAGRQAGVAHGTSGMHFYLLQNPARSLDNLESPNTCKKSLSDLYASSHPNAQFLKRPVRGSGFPIMPQRVIDRRQNLAQRMFGASLSKHCQNHILPHFLEKTWYSRIYHMGVKKHWRGVCSRVRVEF